jgi:UDP-GlcNAc:undecaprenyl-phosphate GlcNAc-1-phosphate transferase
MFWSTPSILQLWSDAGNPRRRASPCRRAGIVGVLSFYRQEVALADLVRHNSHLNILILNRLDKIINSMEVKNIIFAGLTGFVTSVLLVPEMAYLSRRISAISEVGGRHVGTLPIGRLGGVAVVAGMSISFITLMSLDSMFRLAIARHKSQAIGMGLGLLLVFLVGLWDDVKRLNSVVKFIFHLVSASIAYYSGLRILSVDLPMLDAISLGWFQYPFTVLWIVGIVNAANLIDGLDGLAGGVFVISAIVNFVAAFVNDGFFPAGMMVVIGASLCGFLLFNWHPAKIYLGDGGAYAVGFMISVCSLMAPLQKASTSVSFLVPILAIGLPICDTIVTIFRRFLNNRGLFSPDRGHFHHVLLDAGISHRGVVVGLYLVSWVFGSVALAIVFNRQRLVGYVLLATFTLSFGIWGLLFRRRIMKILAKNKTGKDEV